MAFPFAEPRTFFLTWLKAVAMPLQVNGQTQLTDSHSMLSSSLPDALSDYKVNTVVRVVFGTVRLLAKSADKNKLNKLSDTPLYPSATVRPLSFFWGPDCSPTPPDPPLSLILGCDSCPAQLFVPRLKRTWSHFSVPQCSRPSVTFLPGSSLFPSSSQLSLLSHLGLRLFSNVS